MIPDKATLDAEHALAGSILLDGRCMKLLPPDLRDTDFAEENCRLIYQGARVLEANGREIDPILIMDWAKQTQGKYLDQGYLLELMEVTPTAAHAGDYGRKVHENALRREALNILRQAESNTAPLPELISTAVTQLGNLSTWTDAGKTLRACDVPYEPPRWLMEPYFQLGKGTLIQADPGVGKTAFMCAVAACVTTGKGFLGLKVQQPGDVLMLSTEDDLGILRGRIEANGGDLRRVHFLPHTSGLTLNSPEIAQAIQRNHIRLVVFDPFQAFLGAKVDLFRANETRPVLVKLFEMCAANDCACAIVAHLGKVSQGKSSVTQSLGSVDIPGAMRSILHIVRNPNKENEIVAVHIKSSNAKAGKSIAYTIGDKGSVQFQGFTDLTLADLTYNRGSQTSYDTDPMVEVLCTLLAQRGDGFINYQELRDEIRKRLGYDLYHTPRELSTHLSNPDFRRSLKEQDNVILIPNAREKNVRGIRLLHYHLPEGYQVGLHET